MIEAVLFDIDQTLYDQRAAQSERVMAAMDAMGTVFDGLSRADACEAFARANRSALDEEDMPVFVFRKRRSGLFLRAMGISEEHAEAFTHQFVTLRHQKTCALPGATAVVRDLASRYRVGIVSNGIRSL